MGAAPGPVLLRGPRSSAGEKGGGRGASAKPGGVARRTSAGVSEAVRGLAAGNGPRRGARSSAGGGAAGSACPAPSRAAGERRERGAAARGYAYLSKARAGRALWPQRDRRPRRAGGGAGSAPGGVGGAGRRAGAGRCGAAVWGCAHGGFSSAQPAGRLRRG